MLKPVAGLMDGTSKISEGLKNNVTHFDDKPLEVYLTNNSSKKLEFLESFTENKVNISLIITMMPK